MCACAREQILLKLHLIRIKRFIDVLHISINANFLLHTDSERRMRRTMNQFKICWQNERKKSTHTRILEGFHLSYIYRMENWDLENSGQLVSICGMCKTCLKFHNSVFFFVFFFSPSFRKRKPKCKMNHRYLSKTVEIKLNEMRYHAYGFYVAKANMIAREEFCRYFYFSRYCAICAHCSSEKKKKWNKINEMDWMGYVGMN